MEDGDVMVEAQHYRALGRFLRGKGCMSSFLYMNVLAALLGWEALRRLMGGALGIPLLGFTVIYFKSIYNIYSHC
jgi:hypothetical protein